MAAKRNRGLISFVLAVAFLLTGCTAAEKVTDRLNDNRLTTDYNNTVTVLDVGQAACTLIESEGEFCLIDAGMAGGGTDVATYLKQRGADRIDLLVISHFHHDHTSEVMEITRNFDIGTVLIPDLSEDNMPDSYLYESILEDSKNGYFSLEYAKEGKEFTVGSGKVKVLADTYNLDREKDPNNTSVALSYTKDDFVYVNTADIEAKTEKDYLVGYLPQNITMFAAAHHGSQYSNTEQLLEKLSPQFVTISCGEDNEYGHPHKNFLSRLNALDIPYLITYEYGNIVFSMDTKEILPE